MRTISSFLLILLSASAVQGQVEEPVGIQTGTRIRVATGTERIVGSFLSSTPEGVRVRNQSGQTQTFSPGDISSAEVSVGRPVRGGRVAKGVLVGTAVVAGAGALAILASGDGSSGDEGYAWIGLGLLAPISGIIGGIWAAQTAPEEWQSVPVASLTGRGAERMAAMPAIRRITGSGRRIAVGAIVGGIAGGVFATTQRSSAPTAGRLIVTVVPGVLLGGGIAALWGR
jgi:hypothetical protein